MKKYYSYEVRYEYNKHFYYIGDNGITGKSKISAMKAIENLEKKIKKRLLKTQLIEFAKVVQKAIKCSYNGFLGWVENRDLCDDIKSLFTKYTQYNTCYDWVNGNESFKKQLSYWRDKYKITKKNITQKEIIDYILNK